jgi:hypothetical protein
MKISPPAFPTYLADNMAHGMTMRDYFANSAMQSLLLVTDPDEITHEQISWFAYQMANSMMEARNL